MNADLRHQVQTSLRDLRRVMADVGGANEPEMKAAGSVLAKRIRRVLSTRTMHQGPLQPGESGTQGASAPGEPPNRQTGRLARSIGQEVVGGVRRVGSSWFTSRLLEAGVQKVGRRKTKKGSVPVRVNIAPRPFMERALEEALPDMDGVMVGELQRRTAKVGR